MRKQTGESYDVFYARGGWQYDRDEELLFLVCRILQPLRLRPGFKLLELGCGMGFHAGLLHQLGFRVTALDSSASAIQHAQTCSPGPHFINIDAHEFLATAPSDRFDVVFARGMSWFHHDLTGLQAGSANVPEEMRAIFRTLRPGGCFLLQLRTDFSGNVDSTTGIIHHTWSDMVRFLRAYGRLLLLTDWQGLPLCDEQTARHYAGNVLAAVERNS